MIHPTAVVHPGAQIDPTVSVGPCAVIDEHVILGAHCVVGPHVHLTGHLTAGAHNQFHSGCVIGGPPQDLRYKDEPTRVRIGDSNVFRENMTVNRSNKIEEDTVIGSHCFLMADSHVGHNSVLADHVIMANGTLLAGHVTVGDRVFFSGNAMVHQFGRVGRLALLQGGAAATRDVPPYCIARGYGGIAGLNVVGLRRAGFTSEQRLELRRLYHLIFRSRQRLAVALEQARAEFSSENARLLIDFASTSKRGMCSDAGSRNAPAEADA